ncbi:chorismate synthase [Candidatus Bathyarchaeota archaeon]|nr:chorismate synthase [Candidatus Bathyarchaeota archaeon]
MNSIGKFFRVTTFGESHGFCIGVVIDGCPAGLKIDANKIQNELNRRKPGQSSISTNRDESDKLQILSGVFNEHTTNAPICMIIPNNSTDSGYYEKNWMNPRPSHADFTAYNKYGGQNDYRGGGIFSGRITASFVMAGAVAKQLLSETLGITIIGFTSSIGGISVPPLSYSEIIRNTELNKVRCPDNDTALKMIQAIETVRNEGDSIGGTVDCIALNIPVGLGDPIFDTLEGELSKALFAIPAVKAVEFGAGKKFSEMKGSEANDPFMILEGKVITKTNNAGGILGGISTGMPLVLKTTFKPTPSISKPQNTVNLQKLEETVITIHGRHDPCIVPRAVPVVESVVAIVLADHALRAGYISPVLEEKA